MKWLKRFSLLVLGMLLAGSIYVYGSLQGWYTSAQSPEELSNMIEPHLTVFKPAGQGPFETVFMFHGCGGDEQQQIFWGEKFKAMGLAAVYVNSYAGRNIDFDRAISHVCSGRQLIGAERAGDVLTVMAWSKKQAWVDQSRLNVAGWSHGAWSVMDAFAIHAKNELPHGLSKTPNADLADIKNTILFYPYCGFGVKTDSNGWGVTTNILAIDTAEDTVVGTRLCDEKYQAIRDSGSPVRHEVFEGVDHAFDTDAVRTGDNWEYRTPRELAKAAAEKARLLLAEFLGVSPIENTNSVK